jgi:rod shape-determining protein MreD
VKSAAALLAILVVTLLLRSTALTALAARGVVLDVLALATVLWALRYHESWGASFGFLLGLAADLDAAHWMGRHALALSLIGYGVGRLSHTLVRDSSRSQAVLLLIATLLHQVWVAAFEFRGAAAWPYLLERLLLAVLATVLLGTLLVWAVRRLSGQSLFGHAAIEPDPAD